MKQLSIASSVIFLCLVQFTDLSFADDLNIRLLTGGGHTATGKDVPGVTPVNYHFAIQGLLNIQGDSSRRAYGIEVGRHRVFKYSGGEFEYISVGLFIERTFRNFIVGQIGTVGYIGIGENTLNPFGLRASPGLEYPIGEKTIISFFIRQDLIFDDDFIYARSLELGIGAIF